MQLTTTAKKRVKKSALHKKENQSFLMVIVCLSVVGCVLIGVSYFVIINKYEHRSHNQDQYIDSGDYRGLMSKVTRLCERYDDQAQDHINKCEAAKEDISRLAAMADLRAQQTMATATRGLLVSSFFQVFIGIITWVFIGLTLWATWRVLGQAAETTRLAGETLEEAMITTSHAEDSVKAAWDSADASNRTAEAAENAEKARLFIEFESKTEKLPVRHGGSKVHVSIRLTNYGRTPATNMSYETGDATVGTPSNQPFSIEPVLESPIIVTKTRKSTLGTSEGSSSIVKGFGAISFSDITGSSSGRAERIYAARLSYDTVFYDRKKHNGVPEFSESVVVRLVPNGFVFSANARTLADGSGDQVTVNENSIQDFHFEEIVAEIIGEDELDNQQD